MRFNAYLQWKLSNHWNNLNFPSKRDFAKRRKWKRHWKRQCNTFHVMLSSYTHCDETEKKLAKAFVQIDTDNSTTKAWLILIAQSFPVYTSYDFLGGTLLKRMKESFFGCLRKMSINVMSFNWMPKILISIYQLVLYDWRLIHCNVTQISGFFSIQKWLMRCAWLIHWNIK